MTSAILVVVTLLALGAAFFYGRRLGATKARFDESERMVKAQSRMLAVLSATVAEKEESMREMSNRIYRSTSPDDLNELYYEILRRSRGSGSDDVEKP